MKQRMDRSRCVECRREPDMKGELRRLAHGPDENQERDGRGTAYLNAGERREHDWRVGGSDEQFMKLSRSVQGMRQHNSREKGHVADAQEREGSKRSLQRGGMVQVVRKQ